ncbi:MULTISPECIES: MFS transporter [unclassified Paenibacillus]|uniref:MFS transporter n=1 Tax=unclassified Paenibacillus TaxID=185978 RepID=UPI002407659A|nr:MULTISPECIES: MFS transporter [unclassified Paenibacillus]MDF9839762.1 EmrB/QacA subfamily drug resistance transporter [Paenibacillus sp. PastF-2]MDF9846342.1 EmrB/QacA subfamily drug resistance transporter [Paenibacillus sp. PastM-2]MDF9853308.1 EmrB/QacA subfamily drug resistance transporter [Paenibacillus sp. PastF-1]MDH6478188.1 EmrB/QacA subfamily drug resistance transporter [Paenibacillus sp. PastH-2]MDH6506313.1 EmrB/QacA subfamily drug resistance transporter [Paenibacillus sp. PastM
MKNNTNPVTPYIICAGALLSNLSAGMFNVALIDITNDFGQTVQSVQWMITVYLLTISVCLPLMGRLGDMKGKRNIHNLGYLLFSAGSLLCALSPNLACLIVFRIVQGAGAAMFQSTNMALIVSLSSPERRGQALGRISTFVAVGAMIGPSLGGVVVQWFSWHMNFWLLALFSFLIWLAAQNLIPKETPANRSFVDWTGALLFGTALSGLIIGLNLGSTWGWSSAPIIFLLLFSLASGACFGWWSLSPRWANSSRPPFIQLAIFRYKGVLLGIVIAVVSYMAVFSAQLVLPVYLRSILNVEPALAGLLMMAYPAALIIASPISGRLSDRIGSYPIISIGMGGMIASLLLLSFITEGTSLSYIVIFTVALGASMGMISSPNNSMTMGSAPSSSLGFIGSMIALSRNLGMILGTIAGGALMAPSGSVLSAARIINGYVSPGFGKVFLLTSSLVAVTYSLLLLSVRQSKPKNPLHRRGNI